MCHVADSAQPRPGTIDFTFVLLKLYFLCCVCFVVVLITLYILVKVPCECITGNISRGRGREPIKHEAQPSALFVRDHAPSAIFPVMDERELY